MDGNVAGGKVEAEGAAGHAAHIARVDGIVVPRQQRAESVAVALPDVEHAVLIQELRAAGMPAEQADAVVRTIVKSHTELATKHDIERLELRLDSRFALVDAKFDKLTWMMGILIALALANFAKRFF